MQANKIINSDYDVFLSPLKDFKDEISKAGLDNKVVYLDRGDAFHFNVRSGGGGGGGGGG